VSLAAVMGLVVEKMCKNLSARMGLLTAFDPIPKDFVKIAFTKAL
jgi:hypothetical protein